MGLKSELKKIVGAERLSAMKGVVSHYGYSALIRAKGEHKLDILSDNLKVAALISGDFHYFRGYYDLNYFSQDMTKFLCHKLPKAMDKDKNMRCQIGFYDLHQKKYFSVTETKAWCWQQGSRLRWNPVDDNQIVYNDVEDNSYCARIYDLKEKKIVKTIPCALYDITPDMKTGFSLNYSRLQRLRPGYGYSNLKDETCSDNAPENDGLYVVDISSGKVKLLFSLRELATKCDQTLKCEHYLNHISISPDGARMIFFHIYKGESIVGWNVNLYSCNVDGSDLVLLESQDRASHYCWIDSNNMLLTFHKNDGTEYYAFTNVKNGKKKRLGVKNLETDGHPNPVEGTNLFITDTYPLKYGFQYLYQFKTTDQEATQIAMLYHDYRTRGEKRCDLHPSISNDGRFISVDSTYKGGLRSVVVFERYTEIE